jgi:hypothetical protein
MTSLSDVSEKKFFMPMALLQRAGNTAESLF